MMQSKATKIVTGYTTTTSVVTQKAQAYARGYTNVDKPKHHGHKARMHSYTYHVKIYQHPYKLLKSRWEAHLKKAMKKP